MDTSSLSGRPVAEGENRLPAGSTLEIAPGVRVPHPDAAATPAGVEEPRKAGTGVNELLDGTQTPLKDRGALGKDEDGDGVVDINTAKRGSSPMELWQGQNALPQSTNPYLTPEERALASQREASARETAAAEANADASDDVAAK